MIKEGLIVKIIGKKQTLKIIRSFNRLMRKLIAKSHALQMNVEWNFKPIPEWFDHYIDNYYQWHRNRNPMWLERGCFNLLAIKENSNLLELCCGDGFNTYNFYSIRANNIIAVDFDKDAIAHAKKNNQANNINYQTSDIRINLPDDKFDNIVWDAALEHFTKKEIIEAAKGCAVFVEAEKNDCLEAARIMRKTKMHFQDALHLAIASRLKATLISRDKHFYPIDFVTVLLPEEVTLY